MLAPILKNKIKNNNKNKKLPDDHRWKFFVILYWMPTGADAGDSPLSLTAVTWKYPLVSGETYSNLASLVEPIFVNLPLLLAL